MVSNKQFLQMGSFGKGFCKPETKVTNKAVHEKIKFSNCQNQVAFAKTHKTGSSTLQNIFFRYFESADNIKWVYNAKVWGGKGTYICNTWAQLDVFFQGAFQPHNDQVAKNNILTWSLWLCASQFSLLIHLVLSHHIDHKNLKYFSKLPWARLDYDLFVFHRWLIHIQLNPLFPQF